MTDNGKAVLMEHEGEVLHAYQDSEGFWTIGIGHLIDNRKHGYIPQRMSRELFEMDVNHAEWLARTTFEWFDGLDEVRQDVVIMLVFNMGVEGVRTFNLMIEAIKSYLEGETEIQEVVLCVMDQREYAPFESQLATLK